MGTREIDRGLGRSRLGLRMAKRFFLGMSSTPQLAQNTAAKTGPSDGNKPATLLCVTPSCWTMIATLNSAPIIITTAKIALGLLKIVPPDVPFRHGWACLKTATSNRRAWESRRRRRRSQGQVEDGGARAALSKGRLLPRTGHHDVGFTACAAIGLANNGDRGSTARASQLVTGWRG